MEKYKQKLIAMYEILMGRGVLYNIRVRREGNMNCYEAAHGVNHITVVGKSQLD